MSGTANGPSLFGPNGQSLSKKAKDSEGRTYSHNATVEDVYQIVVSECAKVHEYYLEQIPPFVARMVQDALVSYGLVVLTPPAVEGEQPGVERSSEDAGIGIDNTALSESGDAESNPGEPPTLTLPSESPDWRK